MDSIMILPITHWLTVCRWWIQGWERTDSGWLQISEDICMLQVLGQSFEKLLTCFDFLTIVFDNYTQVNVSIHLCNIVCLLLVMTFKATKWFQSVKLMMLFLRMLTWCAISKYVFVSFQFDVQDQANKAQEFLAMDARILLSNCRIDRLFAKRSVCCPFRSLKTKNGVCDACPFPNSFVLVVISHPHCVCFGPGLLQYNRRFNIIRQLNVIATSTSLVEGRYRWLLK